MYRLYFSIVLARVGTVGSPWAQYRWSHCPIYPHAQTKVGHVLRSQLPENQKTVHDAQCRFPRDAGFLKRVRSIIDTMFSSQVAEYVFQMRHTTVMSVCCGLQHTRKNGCCSTEQNERLFPFPSFGRYIKFPVGSWQCPRNIDLYLLSPAVHDRIRRWVSSADNRTTSTSFICCSWV